MGTLVHAGIAEGLPCSAAAREALSSVGSLDVEPAVRGCVAGEVTDRAFWDLKKLSQEP